MTKLLRTIRFDGTDDRVYETGAPEGEIAVSGLSTFLALAPDDITGKVRQAFANGFLGVPSFGRSTFAAVAEISDYDRDGLIDALALHFEHAGAPSAEAARDAAADEVTNAEELCADVPINTVFTLRRTIGDDGELTEEFRIIKPPTDEPLHARVWSIEPDDGTGGSHA